MLARRKAFACSFELALIRATSGERVTSVPTNSIFCSTPRRASGCAATPVTSVTASTASVACSDERMRSLGRRHRGGILLLRMAEPALGHREGDTAVARPALLPEQDRRHRDLVRTLLGYEDRRMAVRTVEPLGV